MTEFLQFGVLGLGVGATYALLAQGVVLIYRGSGIVNFAHGALAMAAAYMCFVLLHDEHEWPVLPAIVVGVAIAAAIGFLFQAVVLRILRGAAAVVRLIATLGLLAVVQSAIHIKYGSDNRKVRQFLPNDVYTVGGVDIQLDRVLLLAVAVAVTVVLWAGVRYTRVGLAITASAENEQATATLGWSPQRLAQLTWTVGGALAGLAGILVAPLTGLSPEIFTLVVTLFALAAALLGGFASFPVTLAGGLLMGVLESEATLYQSRIQDWLHVDSLTGMPRAVPFLVILVIMVVRGRALPLRSHLSDRLPRLGSGRIRWGRLAVASVVVVVLCLWVFDDGWASATAISLSWGVLLLSVVVLVGFAGQVSLAQAALGGIGALIAAQLAARGGLPLELAIVLGILLTIPIGLLFALPALRTRGVNLAVVTLGLGFTVQQVVFNNPTYIGELGDGGTKIGNVRLFGITLDAVNHPGRWAVVCLIGFVLAGLVVANLRRSRTGRRLIAVRTNERAAASLGISVVGVKLYAFGLASGIAALAGILLGFASSTVTYDRFNPFASINAVGNTVIGGAGYVVGGVAGAPNAAEGLGTQILESLFSLGRWDVFVGGVLLLVIIMTHQDGIADAVSHGLHRLSRRGRAVGGADPGADADVTDQTSTEPTSTDSTTPDAAAIAAADPGADGARAGGVAPRAPARPSRPAAPSRLPTPAREPVTPRTLEVRDVTVRFGGVVALSDVRFDVRPGEILGLIGPNGAGKTTLIDAVTGFVRPTSGSVALDGTAIDQWGPARRSQGGLRRSFQSQELFEDITVGENIHAGADESRPVSWLTDLFYPGHHPLPATAMMAVHEFGLETDLDRSPGSLSYGRRRLVGIARAVASAPSVVLLDEPAAGLDEVESAELAELIRRLARERGMAVLLVEHDVDLVMATCDRIVVLDFGKVIATGTPAEIRANPAVLAAYLGGADTTDPETTGVQTSGAATPEAGNPDGRAGLTPSVSGKAKR